MPPEVSRTLASLCPGGEDLRRLLSPESARDLLRAAGVDTASVVAESVRLKPGQGAIVGLRMRDAAGTLEDVLGYVSVVGPRRGRSVYAKALAKKPVPGPMGPGAVLLPSEESVLWFFPNDRHLDDLRWVTDLDKLKRTLLPLREGSGGAWRVRARRSQLVPVRYKPERRFIARAHLAWRDDASGRDEEEDLFLRYFSDSRGDRLFAVNRALSACGGPSVPEGLGAFMAGRLYVERAVPGASLLEDLLTGDGTHGPDLATLVLRLHDAGVSLARGEDVRSRVERALAALQLPAALDEDVAQRLAEIRGRVSAMAWPDPLVATIHGDLHLQQILRTDRGLVLVDLERAASGDPREDLGLLEGQLRVLADLHPESRPACERLAETFQESYFRVAPTARSLDLAPFRALGLLELAWLPFRRASGTWPAEMVRTLDHVLEALAEDLRRPDRFPDESFLHAFAVLHPKPGRRWPGVMVEDGTEIHGTLDPAGLRFTRCPLEVDPAVLGCISDLREATLVSRRAGSRAVFAVTHGGRPAFAKTTEPKRARRSRDRLLVARALAIRSGPEGVEVPSILEDASDRGLLVLSALEGRTLHTDLMEGDGALGALERCARALALWHAVRAEGMGLDAPRPDADLAAMLAAVGPVMGRVARDRAARLVAATPASAAPAAVGPVHGDLHDKNVVLGPAVGLLDLDALRLGNPEDDVGNLVAHGVLRALQSGRGVGVAASWETAFVRAYGEGGGVLDTARTRIAKARTLVRLVLLYGLRARWHALVPQLSEAAGTAIEECG